MCYMYFVIIKQLFCRLTPHEPNILVSWNSLRVANLQPSGFSNSWNNQYRTNSNDWIQHNDLEVMNKFSIMNLFLKMFGYYSGKKVTSHWGSMLKSYLNLYVVSFDITIGSMTGKGKRYIIKQRRACSSDEEWK